METHYLPRHKERKILNAAEFLYHIGYSLKKRYALRHRRRLPHTVVSLGNITVGGTGKTPAVIALAEEAKRRGYLPLVLTRGYRGRAHGPCFVAERKEGGAEVRKLLRDAPAPPFCCTAREAGDEPALMAGRLPGVPIIKCADRYAGGMFALSSLAPDLHLPLLFLLDDGFQHWRLEREVDVVLVDGLDPYGNGRMLPAGSLRGPLNELRRAQLLVITKARNEEVRKELERINPEAPVYFSGYRVKGVRNGKGEAVPGGMLLGKRMYAFCGIARPESFIRTVESLGAQVCGVHSYRDHHRYTESDGAQLQRLGKEAGCDFLVTTEKDWVKLAEAPLPENLLCIEIEWAVDKEFYNDLFRRVS
ncbi:MAG: tetraacyldisaccharide 4'-kinase [Thermodesulfovibrionales bacterium]